MHTRARIHIPACAVTYTTHTHTHTAAHTAVRNPNAEFRALRRPGALPPRRAGRRAHPQTRAPSPRGSTPLAAVRALCCAAPRGGRRGAAAAAAERAEEAEQGAGSRLARAPPAGRGFSSLSADAVVLPAAAGDHGRQRDTVSWGRRPGLVRMGRRGRGRGRAFWSARWLCVRGQPPGTQLSSARVHLCGRRQGHARGY